MSWDDQYCLELVGRFIDDSIRDMAMGGVVNREKMVDFGGWFGLSHCWIFLLYYIYLSNFIYLLLMIDSICHT